MFFLDHHSYLGALPLSMLAGVCGAILACPSGRSSGGWRNSEMALSRLRTWMLPCQPWQSFRFNTLDLAELFRSNDPRAPALWRTLGYVGVALLPSMQHWSGNTGTRFA